MKQILAILLLLVLSLNVNAQEKSRFNLFNYTSPLKISDTIKPAKPPIIETHITNSGAKTLTTEPKSEMVAAPQIRKASDGGPDWRWDENRRVWWRTVPITYTQPQYRPVVSQPVFRNFRSYSVRSGSC